MGALFSPLRRGSGYRHRRDRIVRRQEMIRAHATNFAGKRKDRSVGIDHTANGKEAEFLIILPDQADLGGADALATKEEKGRYVRDALWTKAETTQGPLLNWLRGQNVEHRSYYIVNMIWVKGSRDVALALAARPDVARLEGNPQIQNYREEPPAIDETAEPNTPTAVETGINYTKAPLVWATGFTGQGVVVADADTGFRWDHNALKNKYRGWNGAAANHDYNWHDSIHTGGGTCGANSLAPCDDFGHGTHTLGTMVGDDGAGNQVGMAPGAKWIGCRNMDQGAGTPARYIECMEFFLAPYPVSGTPAQGNPSLAPDVTSNSWGCPASEGCSITSLQAAVEAQRVRGHHDGGGGRKFRLVLFDRLRSAEFPRGVLHRGRVEQRRRHDRLFQQPRTGDRRRESALEAGYRCARHRCSFHISDLDYILRKHEWHFHGHAARGGRRRPPALGPPGTPP